MGQGYPHWCTDMSAWKPRCREKMLPDLPTYRRFWLKESLGFVFCYKWTEIAWNLFFCISD